MKKFLLAVAVIVITVSVNAQTTFELGANIGTGTKKGYTTTYGVDAQANFGVASKSAITVSGGYQNANFKYDFGAPIGTIKDDFGFVIGFAGFLQNLTAKLQAHAQLGYATSTTSGGGGHFSYAPSLIYWIAANFSLGLKYLSIDEYNAVLLRLAYKFAGKK